MRSLLRDEINPMLLFKVWPDYVITRGSTLTNTQGVDTPIVLLEDGLYRMWYESQVPGLYYVGYAESSDGITWTLREQPVFAATDIPWGNGIHVIFRRVIKVGHTYYAWYHATNATTGKANIGLATSPNGLDWTDSGSPIIIPDDFDVTTSGNLTDPSVYFDGTTYHVLYTGFITSPMTKVFYATATNPLGPYTKHGLAIEPRYDMNEIGALADCLLYLEGRYWLFYAPFRLSSQHVHPMKEMKFAIGMMPGALKRRGIIFTRSTLSPTGLDSPDDPFVMQVDNKLKMWYGTDNNAGIGYAEADITIDLLRARFPIEEPHLPPFRETLWDNETIEADDTSLRVVCFGYTHKTIHFLSDTDGTLTIQVWIDESGTWRDFDTIAVTANTLTSYIMTGLVYAIRLSFSAAANVSAWLFMDKG